MLADVEFITATGGSGFVPDFNGSVVSRYCVSHVKRSQPVDYVSCNGRDTEHYRCTCNVFIDRCIGRLDTSECKVVTRKTPSGAHFNETECSCSASSAVASRQYIGAMPVYYPFPKFRRHTKSTAECVPELVPPATESVYLGDWYSMPAAAECRSDEVALPGRGGCTWARRATHHIVHGFQLLGAGFVYGKRYDADTLRHNDQVIEGVLARHPVRCCDC